MEIILSISDWAGSLFLMCVGALIASNSIAGSWQDRQVILVYSFLTGIGLVTENMNIALGPGIIIACIIKYAKM